MQNYFQLIYLCFDKFKKHFQSDFLALQQHHDLLHSVFCLTYKLQNLEDALPKTGETGGTGDTWNAVDTGLNSLSHDLTEISNS